MLPNIDSFPYNIFTFDINIISNLHSVHNKTTYSLYIHNDMFTNFVNK